MSYYYNCYDIRKKYPQEQEVNDEPKIVRRFTATIGDRVFVRNSPKVFTHAVVGHKEGKPFECLKWCGNSTFANEQAEFHKKIGFLDVQIIEAVASKYVKEIDKDKKQ